MSTEQGVLVTPLQPPFIGPYELFAFNNCNPLAVSMTDGDKIRAMLGGNCVQRLVTLEAAADGIHIRVSAVPS